MSFAHTAVGAKAPRKQFGASSSSSVGSPNNSGGGKNKNSGGNPVKWWPSPKWQKGKLPGDNNIPQPREFKDTYQFLTLFFSFGGEGIMTIIYFLKAGLF